jgi:hypothetical protein
VPDWHNGVLAGFSFFKPSAATGSRRSDVPDSRNGVLAGFSFFNPLQPLVLGVLQCMTGVMVFLQAFFLTPLQPLVPGVLQCLIGVMVLLQALLFLNADACHLMGKGQDCRMDAADCPSKVYDDLCGAQSSVRPGVVVEYLLVGRIRRRRAFRPLGVSVYSLLMSLQEVQLILWNPNIHNHINKNLTLRSVLS